MTDEGPFSPAPTGADPMSAGTTAFDDIELDLGLDYAGSWLREISGVPVDDLLVAEVTAAEVSLSARATRLARRESRSTTVIGYALPALAPFASVIVAPFDRMTVMQRALSVSASAIVALVFARRAFGATMPLRWLPAGTPASRSGLTTLLVTGGGLAVTLAWAWIEARSGWIWAVVAGIASGLACCVLAALLLAWVRALDARADDLGDEAMLAELMLIRALNERGQWLYDSRADLRRLDPGPLVGELDRAGRRFRARWPRGHTTGVSVVDDVVRRWGNDVLAAVRSIEASLALGGDAAGVRQRIALLIGTIVYRRDVDLDRYRVGTEPSAGARVRQWLSVVAWVGSALVLSVAGTLLLLVAVRPDLTDQLTQVIPVPFLRSLTTATQEVRLFVGGIGASLIGVAARVLRPFLGR